MIRLTTTDAGIRYGRCQTCETAVFPGPTAKFRASMHCPHCEVPNVRRISTSRLLQCAYPECQHRWIKRGRKMPKSCPRCGRRGWLYGMPSQSANGIRYDTPTGRRIVPSEPEPMQAVS